jgi:Type II secretion system (T2SS), protein E, N-terminal domain
MVSSPGDHINDQATPLEDFAAPAKPKAVWTAQFNAEQVFRLIDSILPFEACLYHQVLPLSLEGSRLKLGMVNLDDAAALDYVRRILAYMNCSLVPQTLATDVHHAALSAYLSYTGSQKQPLSRPTTARAIAQHTGQRLTKDAAKNGASAVKKDAIDAAEAHIAQDSHPTFLVDSPEDLNFQDLDIATPPAPPHAVLAAPVTPPAAARLRSPALPKSTVPQEQATEHPNDASRLRETLILSNDL